MNKIFIALATDKIYIKQTCLVIESVLMTSIQKDVYYHFYVMMPCGELDDANIYFENIKNKYSVCTIEGIEITNKFEHANLPIEHITTPTYYRLMLPEIVKQKRCLYLDSDIIVCDSLLELYNIDIEGYDVAGVIAPLLHQMEKSEEYALKIGIPSIKQYVNAGVLLFNLEEMRKDKFMERALELVEMPFLSQDQDIINRLAYNKIKLVPYKYNVQTSREKYTNIILESELEESRKHPVILHYSDNEKPWECLDSNKADKWWEFCRKSLLFNDFYEEQKMNFLYHGVIQNLRLWKVNKYSMEWLEEIKKYKNRYIYGAGVKGEKAAVYFRGNGIFIAGILVSELDGNRKWVEGIEVKKFTCRIEEDALIFIAVAKRYQLAIKRMLIRNSRFYIMPLDDI